MCLHENLHPHTIFSKAVIASIFHRLYQTRNIVVTSAAYEDHVWGNSEWVLVQKKACLSFVKHFIVWMQMCFFFVGTLHLIHYVWPAREIMESESIQKAHDRARCSAELFVN